MKLEITWKFTLSFLVNDANYGNTRWIAWQYHVAHVKRKKNKAFRWNMWLTQFCCHFNIFVMDGFLFWPNPNFQKLRFDQRYCFFQLLPTYVCIILYLKINFITCWTEWMLFIMIYFKIFTSVGICFENIIVTKVLKHFHWVFLAAVVLVVHIKIIFVIVVVVIVILTKKYREIDTKKHIATFILNRSKGMLGHKYWNTVMPKWLELSWNWNCKKILASVLK